MRHIWSVLCNKAVVDPDNNLLSLRDLIEELSVDLPKEAEGKAIKIPIEFEVVSYWVAKNKTNPQNGESIIEIYDPKGKELAKIPQNITFENNTHRLRTRMRISGMGLTGSGEYTFKVKYKAKGDKTYKEVAELPLFVNLNFKESKEVK